MELGNTVRSGIRRVSAMLVAPRTCEWLFRVVCGAWIAYQVLRSSYYWPILDEWGKVSVDFFYHRLPLVIAYVELAKALRKEYGLRDVVALFLAAAMMLYAVRREIHADVCMLLLVLCARHFDARRTLRFCGWVLAGALVVVLVSAASGVIDDIILYQGNRTRHCMGFTYALFSSQYLFCLTCVVCALRGKRLSIAEGALLLAINTLAFVLTDSRLSFGVAVLLIAGTLLLGRWRVLDERMDWLWACLSWSFVIVFAVSVMAPLVYGWMGGPESALAIKLNRAVGSRLGRAYQVMSEYGVSAFGQFVPFVGNGLNQYGQVVHTAKYFYVDILFVRALVERGWVYVACLVALWTRVTRVAYKQGDHALLLALGAMAAHVLLDDLALDVHYNLLLLLLGSYGAVSQGEGKVVETPVRAVRWLPKSHEGWAGFGAMCSVCGLLGLFVLGFLGSMPTSLAGLVGTRSIVSTHGDVILRLDCKGDGAATLSHHGAELRGKLALKRSNNTSASFELCDADGAYALTLVTPRDVTNGACTGIWKIYNPSAPARDSSLLDETSLQRSFVSGERFSSRVSVPHVVDEHATREVSDFIELEEDGAVRWRTGSYSVLDESNENLRSLAAKGTWKVAEKSAEVSIDAVSLAVIAPPLPPLPASDAPLEDASAEGVPVEGVSGRGIAYRNDRFGVSFVLADGYRDEAIGAANDGETMELYATDAAGNHMEVFSRNMLVVPTFADEDSWAQAFAEGMELALTARGDAIVEPVEADGATVRFAIEHEGVLLRCTYQFTVRDGVGLCVANAVVGG